MGALKVKNPTTGLWETVSLAQPTAVAPSSLPSASSIDTNDSFLGVDGATGEVVQYSAPVTRQMANLVSTLAYPPQPGQFFASGSVPENGNTTASTLSWEIAFCPFYLSRSVPVDQMKFRSSVGIASGFTIIGFRRLDVDAWTPRELEISTAALSIASPGTITGTVSGTLPAGWHLWVMYTTAPSGTPTFIAVQAGFSAFTQSRPTSVEYAAPGGNLRWKRNLGASLTVLPSDGGVAWGDGNEFQSNPFVYARAA